jgi:hypothetical protein
MPRRSAYRRYGQTVPDARPSSPLACMVSLQSLILTPSSISLTCSPRFFTGKFSIRLVPDMTTAKVTECVLKYVKEEFAKIDTKCKMSVEMVHGGEPWMADPNVSILFAIFSARLGVLTWSLVRPAALQLPGRSQGYRGRLRDQPRLHP